MQLSTSPSKYETSVHAAARAPNECAVSPHLRLTMTFLTLASHSLACAPMKLGNPLLLRFFTWVSAISDDWGGARFG